MTGPWRRSRPYCSRSPLRPAGSSGGTSPPRCSSSPPVSSPGRCSVCSTFIVFGAAILGPALDEITWQVVAYALLSLTLVRMVPVALATLGTGARRPTVAFLGWFGPRGLASIVFGVMMLQQGALPHQQSLLLAIVLTVGISVYAHA